MGYAKIPQVIKEPTILMFKDCYALEKIHGSSAHVSWKEGRLSFYAGGAKHEDFVKIFDQEALTKAFTELGQQHAIIYGEAYGGRMQGMSHIYGKELSFCAFDVRFHSQNDTGYWIDVPKAEAVVLALGLEFVPYHQVPATKEALDSERDRPSEIAERRGMGSDKKREGVVCKSLVEMTGPHGRVISKHRIYEHLERRTNIEIGDTDKLKLIEDAEAAAEEFCVPMRLIHVLDKLPEAKNISAVASVIDAMIQDILVEAGDEVVDSRALRKAIGKQTVKLFKQHLEQLNEKA